MRSTLSTTTSQRSTKTGGVLVRLILFAVLACWPISSHAEPLNPTQAFAKHKGFMVFLNWYFLQDAPMIITDHFRSAERRGQWTRYRGKYGAFHDIEVGVCQNKITEVKATTHRLPGGINSFLKTWLEGRLMQKVVRAADTEGKSHFQIVDQAAKAPCAAPEASQARLPNKAKQL